MLWPLLSVFGFDLYNWASGGQMIEVKTCRPFRFGFEMEASILLVWRRQKIPYDHARSAALARPRELESGYHLFQSDHYRIYVKQLSYSLPLPSVVIDPHPACPFFDQNTDNVMRLHWSPSRLR